MKPPGTRIYYARERIRMRIAKALWRALSSFATDEVLGYYVYPWLGVQQIVWALRRYRVNCVLDVGAHAGQYATSLRQAGYRGHIFSFEPVPELAERLAQAAEGDPRWSVYAFALGNRDATVPMNVVPEATGSSFLRPSEYGIDRYEEFLRKRTEHLPVRRLDEILDDVLIGIENPRLYLKLDTQGYDLEVFAGAGERVHEFVGMQSELAALSIYEGMVRMPEALATYEAAGFGIIDMFPVTQERRTGRTLEFDCVMIRPEQAL